MDLYKKLDEWLEEQQEAEQQNHPKGFVGCRGYWHFDSRIGIKRCINDTELHDEICDVAKLRQHKFWPFIRFDKKVRRFVKNAKKEIEIKNKTRKIMYASHKDAVIMAFYAWLLKQNYEKALSTTVASDSVIGYRKIPISRNRNKSNIDFSKEVFETIQHANSSVVFCLDISDFFGNINHDILEKSLAKFLGGIPRANIKPVLKAVTRFRYVFKQDAEKALNDKQGRVDSKKYNALVQNGDILLHKNKKTKGIPQGSPISDILANIYLFDFDLWLAEKVQGFGGLYFRYSDDILLIVPEENAKDIYDDVRRIISGIEYKLNIKREKTEAFFVDAKSDKFEDITQQYFAGYKKHKDSAQYLGFLMNRKHMSIRPGTIAKHYRKEVQKIRNKKRSAKKSEVGSEEKHQPVKPQKNKKYQYFKISSKKVGNSVKRQFRRVRRRTKKIHSKK